MSDYRIETKCVQGGYTPGNGEPRQIPIIQSTTFKYATSEDMGKLFDLEASGYFYTRLQKSVSLRAVLLQCSPLQVRQHPSMQFSILQPVVTMLFLLPQFMAEHTTFSQLQ